MVNSGWFLVVFLFASTYTSSWGIRYWRDEFNTRYYDDTFFDRFKYLGSHKREATGPFQVDLKLNPCLYESYDVNGNKELTLEKLLYIFENHRTDNPKEEEWVKKLFRALDDDEDNVVTEDEFKSVVSAVISGC